MSPKVDGVSLIGCSIVREPADTKWAEAKAVIGNTRVTLGPTASHSWLYQPDHLAFQLARYRAAAALIGDAQAVAELGCGEGIGAGILAKGRRVYIGYDNDLDALRSAGDMYANEAIRFDYANILSLDGDTADPLGGWAGAAVLLDVIEHIPANMESRLMDGIIFKLTPDGVCVIGTPNAAFDHLASPQSKAGHVNLYTHARLHALMSRHFRVVQSFGLQDVSLHLGHPEARHYLLLAGIGVRR